MVESWIVVLVGTFVMAIAATGVVGHYLRERHRARLLKNLDHHDWCRSTRAEAKVEAYRKQKWQQ